MNTPVGRGFLTCNKKLETTRIEMSDEKTIEIAMAAERMYAEAHPRPPHVTQEQAAEMLHCGL
jgi:hypothetical protein